MTPGLTHIPTVKTERLILRGPARADFPAFAEMLASDRAIHMGGPFDVPTAWRLFCAGLASWPLDGFGTWMIEDRTTGAFLGDVGPSHPLRFPEPELGWTLTDAAEGYGFAQEAAAAALDWFWTHFADSALVSYVAKDNVRSAALANRLGATLDTAAALPDGETPDETIVFRHRRPQ